MLRTVALFIKVELTEPREITVLQKSPYARFAAEASTCRLTYN